jgi:transposase
MWSSSRTKALIRARLAALEAFGGVPLVTVCDNPKTVVLTRKGELIVWNPVSGQVALDYRLAPELCWPRAGQQKGAVENLVGWARAASSGAGASTTAPTSRPSSRSG